MKADGFRRALVGFTLAGGLTLAVAVHAAGTASASLGPPQAKSPDLAALHDAGSPSFSKDCLTCHADVMKKSTLDRKVRNAHAAMVPFAPGYDSKKGVTSAVCVSCHERVDVVQHSAAQIRRNVSVDACVACHGKSGPSSRKFYAN